MATEKDDAAFPSNPLHLNEAYQCSDWTGLTKREYFAALALQGILSTGTSDSDPPDILAKYAVECAERLIDELNKP